jgi:hypothetical protein
LEKVKSAVACLVAMLYGDGQDPVKPGNLNHSYDSGDGQHPNNAGYRQIASTVYNAAFAS